jgi:hypothetical protein
MCGALLFHSLALALGATYVLRGGTVAGGRHLDLWFGARLREQVMFLSSLAVRNVLHGRAAYL